MGLPLEGIRVIEMSHMIMGPSCGMFLAQLGAEVIKVEPPGGDKTRDLKGMGLSFFPLFNRGKKSVVLDLKGEAGRAALGKLLAGADVFIENFKDGALDGLGLDSATLQRDYPGLILAHHKGFLSGPYRNRLALDEVVQMMAGLAYMTGPPGQPLRAGSSANDIMCGLLGAFAVVTALRERDQTGKGRDIRIGLFENCLLLVAQHMVQFEISGERPKPMPVRDFSWPIYDVFTAADDKQIFVAVVTEGQWQRFCDAFGLDDLKNDPALATQMDRINARRQLIPIVADLVAKYAADDILAKLSALELPCSPINSPVDLYDDPHVNRPGGLVTSHNVDGGEFRAPALPLEFDGSPVEGPADVPPLGADSEAILTQLGYDAPDIAAVTGNTTQSSTSR